MSNLGSFRKLTLGLVLAAALGGVSACEEEPTAEQAGEAVEQTGEQTGQAVEQAGEQAGEAVEQTGEQPQQQ